ncbi:MAG TPA: NUDIX domain-containing protein [Verrucomicrobiota bacterium]|nr:NUDIX domain-containing protein [Verrucomicrobiota bacterium]
MGYCPLGGLGTNALTQLQSPVPDTKRKPCKHSRSNFGIIAQIEEDGKVSAVVLSVQEQFKKGALHRSLIFPGGSLNPGETDKVNLIRELGEEISCDQSPLSIQHESVSFVLELKKPGDYGGRLTQNFWYLPMSEAIKLRGEEQPELMESDGACLGRPTLLDVSKIILQKDLKLAHLAAIVVFMGKLMNSTLARKAFHIEDAMSKKIRERYLLQIEPYLSRTHLFLERLRSCKEHKEYVQNLHSFCKDLEKARRTV